MKKIIILFIGICVMQLSPKALASPTPISNNYLPQAIQRIDNGLANASTSDPANNFFLMFFSWLDEVQTIIASSIDTENRIVLHQEDLERITPCLHFDILLLQGKIDEINNALKSAFREKRVGDIWKLKRLLRYANQRHNRLILGSTNPEYVDKEYHWLYSFDNDGWCCTEPSESEQCVVTARSDCRSQDGLISSNAEECSRICNPAHPSDIPVPVCPFDTNYLPPTAEGYGCDLETMDAVLSNANNAFLEERNALSFFEQKKDDFLRNQASGIGLADDIYEITGQEAPPLGTWRTQVPRTHKRESGCLESIPEGAARLSLRTPFSFSKDHIAISRLVERISRIVGEEREQEDFLKYPSEFEDGSVQQQEAMARDESMGIVKKVFKGMLRGYYTRKNIEQSSNEANPFIQSIDSQQQIADVFKPLRQPIKEIVVMASYRDRGIRKFTTNYAFFLRSSCIYRPCNEILDRVLKITLEDSCFPYANGMFKNSNSPHTYQKCINDAGVTEF